MAKKFLTAVYGDDKPVEVKALYDQWAASYDDEITENGYATPRRCAEALASLTDKRSMPVLDVGCGTGLSGLALRAAGFETIDGVDLSAAMLAEAGARDGIYRRLQQVTIKDPLPFADGIYSNAVAVGVISPEHAPPETVDTLLDLLPSGGHLVFSLNDYAMGFAEFSGKIADVTQAGTAELVFEEHGPHLPGIKLEAMVFGLRKA